MGGVFWDGANIYVGTSAGLLVSTNGGASFAVAPVTGIPAGEFIVSFAGAKQDGSVRFLAVTVDTVWPDIPTGDIIWSYKGVYRLDLGGRLGEKGQRSSRIAPVPPSWPWP